MLQRIGPLFPELEKNRIIPGGYQGKIPSSVTGIQNTQVDRRRIDRLRAVDVDEALSFEFDDEALEDSGGEMGDLHSIKIPKCLIEGLR